MVDQKPFSPPHLCDNNISLTSLPDHLLSFMLSHLTLRDAVRTAILSTRWKYLWTAMPRLQLDWYSISGARYLEQLCGFNRQAYVKNVDQVIKQYSNQDIESFQLFFCFDKAYVSDVDRWMSFAAKKRLNSLDLRFSFTCILNSFHLKGLKKDKMFQIPSSLVDRLCSLKDLHLHTCILSLSSDFAFKGLVTLDLTYVQLEGIRWSSLINSCTTVEWMKLKGCNLPAKFCVDDNLSNLRFLMIKECHDLREFKLRAKNLKTFEFIGREAVKCSFQSCSRLEIVYLFLTKEENRAENLFSDLASNLPTLKTLILRGVNPLIHKLPTHPSTLFRSVSRLVLFMKLDGVELLTSLPCLLKSFPLLEKLYVQMPFKKLLAENASPEAYLHTRLKEVELSEFKVIWIEFASFFMRSAIVLEQMILRKSYRSYEGCGNWRNHSSVVNFSENQRQHIRCKLEEKSLSPKAKVLMIT